MARLRLSLALGLAPALVAPPYLAGLERPTPCLARELRAAEELPLNSFSFFI